MVREDKLKVKLLSWTGEAESNVAAAIRQCYSTAGADEILKKTDEKTKKRLIRQVIASGHMSTIEHASFTFAIEGISRITETQLVRHRVGTSFSVQSGRYVKRAEVSYRIPEAIKKSKLKGEYEKYLTAGQRLYEKLIEAGIKIEDARYCQPQSLQTKMVVSMNARTLLHFFELRCCQRAQWEIRALAEAMLKLVRKKAPLLFELAGASCAVEGICWEGNLSCGAWKQIEGGELRVRGQFRKRKNDFI